MDEGYYDTAQICLNGHVVNSMVKKYPKINQKFCDRCGEPTIMQCQHCNTDIRGCYHRPDGWPGAYDKGPFYCHNCGKAFPWTEKTIEAAKELSEEFEELTEEEKQLLKSSLEDLFKETPKTKLAENRFKRVMKKVGKAGYEEMKGLLVDIVSEAVKKAIFN